MRTLWLALLALTATAVPLLVAPPVYADSRLETVREAIAARGLGWTAAETSRSRMSDAARRASLMRSYPWPDGYRLDAEPAPPVSHVEGGAIVLNNANVPRFSWDDLGGVSYVTPVRDQGSCGSCFIFASLAAMEVQYRIVRQDPGFPIDLSEQEVISCITFGSCSAGGFAEEVALYLERAGVPDESCFRYTSGQSGLEGECGRSCGDVDRRRHRIRDFSSSLVPWSDERIKEELLNGPVITNMQTYADFDYYAGGVYRRVSNAQSGWHMVAIIGWDDSDHSWIAKNSWGADWGVQGYFKISRETDCDITWPIEDSSGVCFATHTAVLEVTAGEVYDPVLPDAGVRSDAASSPDSGSDGEVIIFTDAAVGEGMGWWADAGFSSDVARPDTVRLDTVRPDAVAPSLDAGSSGLGPGGSGASDSHEGAVLGAGSGCAALRTSGLGGVPLLLLALAWVKRRRGRPRAKSRL